MIKTKVLIILTFILSCYLYYRSPYKIEFIGHYDKIWSHRINDTIKLINATRYFDGIELDLVYYANNNKLDVNHPPEKSKNISFSKYISKLPENTTISLWLDIKNLKLSNSKSILRLINKTIKSKNIPKTSIIIETQYPDALPIFDKAGYKTSYYLPLDIETNLKRIRTILSNQPKIAISSDYRNYEIMKRRFPNRTKYLWMIDDFRSHKFKARQILNDTLVKVLLVKFNN